MATLGGIRNNTETKYFFEQQLTHWKKYGYGEWIVFEKASDCFIGRCGLRCIIINEKYEIEVGYKLLSDFWGRGLATELAETTIWVAFEKLRLPELVCYTTQNNQASIRVMEKVGFSYECDIVKNNQRHVFYRLKRSIWKSRNNKTCRTNFST
jgi:RimJ/RimL family protein N-acetyltransferase